MQARHGVAMSLLLVMVGGCSASKQVSVVTPVLPQESVQVSSYLTAENQPSCEDKAWAFNPENDIPDFSDSCAWRSIAGEPFSWIHRFAVEESGRSIEVQLGCRQTYVHRYANIVGEAFYVFCQQGRQPDIKEWSVPGDESPVGWVAFADEGGGWIPLGWGAHFKLRGQMDLESIRLYWVELTFRSNQGEVVSRVFKQKEE